MCFGSVVVVAVIHPLAIASSLRAPHNGRERIGTGPHSTAKTDHVVDFFFFFVHVVELIIPGASLILFVLIFSWLNYFFFKII